MALQARQPRIIVRWLVTSILLATTALGQSFNIDLGNASGTPSSAYAARGLPGTWNTLCFAGTSRYRLLRLHGTPSDVTLDEFSHNVCDEYPYQDDDEYALFGDGVVLIDIVDSWILRELESGDYTVIAYVLSPGSLTGVDVYAGVQCTPAEVVQIGDYFVEYQTSVTDGILRISAVGGFAWSSEIYGFQLVLQDCNHNGRADSIDVSTGESADCNRNVLPDECEMDCDGDGVHDPCGPAFVDCNSNLLNDVCEDDCNGSGKPDDCDVAAGTSPDTDANGVPDECQRVLNVPVEFSTIQAALDVARTGDAVLVEDGVYAGPGNRDLDFHGKGVTLRSRHGPQTCVLDVGGAGRGFLFDDGEPTTAVIDGFTITNGDADSGGAIRCHNLSQPTIRRCVIRGNHASRGGGIFCTYASPIIDRCWIVENEAWIGGGISQHTEANIALTNSLIANNHSVSWGAALEVLRGSLAMTGCTVSGNTADDARAIFVYDGWLTVRNSIIWGNTVPEGFPNGAAFSDIRGWPGGGVSNLDSDPLFQDPLAGDYRLSPGSPCINAGDPAFVPQLGETDLNGHPRVLCGRVDMGAYEFGIGDYDCNQTVDLADFAAWEGCMTGPVASSDAATERRSDEGANGADMAVADGPSPLPLSQGEISPHPTLSHGKRGSGCEAFDFNADDTIDLLDFAAFQRLSITP